MGQQSTTSDLGEEMMSPPPQDSISNQVGKTDSRTGCLTKRYSQLLGHNKDPNYEITVKNTLNKRQNLRCSNSTKVHSLNLYLGYVSAKILRIRSHILVTLITLEWRRTRFFLNRALLGIEYRTTIKYQLFIQFYCLIQPLYVSVSWTIIRLFASK
jgi:hypothetical protein